MIIVTGGAGFIGSNLVAELNDSGHSDIIIVDELGTSCKWRNIAKRRFLDIVFPSELDKLLSQTKAADVVFHMGANSSTTAVDADDIIRTNLRPSMAWWNWCSRTRSPLLYASSAATYGDGASGFDDCGSIVELTKLRPLNLYGWSKHTFDIWAQQEVVKGNAPPRWAGFKFFNVYGPNEYHKGEMQSLVAKNTAYVQAGKTVTLFKSHRLGVADGEQLRDFVYVKDCLRVMLQLAQNNNVASGLYNLGTGTARSFKDLILAIGRALGVESRIEYRDMPVEIRANYQYFTQARMEKLSNAGLTLSPTSLEDGVRDYVQTYLAGGDKYR
jgi:ADP-L-glycero-D-manno-heptose 6-epimerase